MGSLLITPLAGATQSWRRMGWATQASANERRQGLARLTGGFWSHSSVPGPGRGRYVGTWGGCTNVCGTGYRVTSLSASGCLPFGEASHFAPSFLWVRWAAAGHLKLIHKAHHTQCSPPKGYSWSPVGMATRPCCASFWPMISAQPRPAVSGELQGLGQYPLASSHPSAFVRLLSLSLELCARKMHWGQGVGMEGVGSLVSERKEAK